MKKITRNDILKNEDYLKERDQRRKQIIALKNLRRVEVGPLLSFTFENRETVKYQIQEMMRIENITAEDKIQNEINIYNQLIPEAGCLSATMFIEVPDYGRIREILDRFQGLDRPDTVFLKIGEDKVFAEFEPGHSKEDRISAVHYLKFRLTPEQIRRFKTDTVELHIQHRAYKHSAVLSNIQKEEVAKDLQD